MKELLEPETGRCSGEEFLILYTGMPDGRELEERLNGREIVEAPDTGRLYFTASETQALNDYVLQRRLHEDYNPVVLEAWLPEDPLDDWVTGAEFTAESYPVQNIRGYTDVETGKFVEHGEGWTPENSFQKLKNMLGVEEQPEYLLPEDTEFDPLSDW
ncbi:MAG: hypothetical protein ABEK10_01090 [Candidatus Nanosalina sp.]